MAEKYLWKSSIFRNVTVCNSSLKASLHFKKMANSSRKGLQTYSKICIFCVIKYIDFKKESGEGALKVFEKSLKTVLDKVHFIVNLYCFTLPPVSQANPYFPQVSHLTPSQAKNFQNSPFFQTHQQ